MNVRVRRAATFWFDFEFRFQWYMAVGGDTLADRLEASIERTIDRIAFEPTLGRVRHFRHPRLQGLRSLKVNNPFGKLLVFYRFDGETVEIWRIMHGARDLGRRLLQPNS